MASALTTDAVPNPDSQAGMDYNLAQFQAQIDAGQVQWFIPRASVQDLGGGAIGGSDSTFMDCGVITCTIWFSWYRTQWLNNEFGGDFAQTKAVIISAVAGAMCLPLGGFPSLACAGAVAIRYQSIADHLAMAVLDRKCSAWKITRPAFVPGPLGPMPVVSIVGLNEWTSHDGHYCSSGFNGVVK